MKWRTDFTAKEIEGLLKPSLKRRGIRFEYIKKTKDGYYIQTSVNTKQQTAGDLVDNTCRGLNDILRPAYWHVVALFDTGHLAVLAFNLSITDRTKIGVKP